MSVNSQDLLTTVMNLCDQALGGELSLEEFCRLRPQRAPLDPFLFQTLDDIEDAIEHFPGFWFKKEPNFKEWFASNIFLTLYLDSLLLKRTSQWNPGQIMQQRDLVLKQKPRSKDEIDKLLQKL